MSKLMLVFLNCKKQLIYLEEKLKLLVVVIITMHLFPKSKVEM